MKQDDDERANLDQKWAKLNTKIKSQTPEYMEPVVPFKSSNLIKNFNDLYSKIYDKEKFIQS